MCLFAMCMSSSLQCLLLLYVCFLIVLGILLVDFEEFFIYSLFGFNFCQIWFTSSSQIKLTYLVIHWTSSFTEQFFSFDGLVYCLPLWCMILVSILRTHCLALDSEDFFFQLFSIRLIVLSLIFKISDSLCFCTRYNIFYFFQSMVLSIVTICWRLSLIHWRCFLLFLSTITDSYLLDMILSYIFCSLLCSTDLCDLSLNLSHSLGYCKYCGP